MAKHVTSPLVGPSFEVDDEPGAARQRPERTVTLVEYEGGGDVTRSNPWLAELQQDMFAEINAFDANNAGIRDGEMIWVHTPEGAKVKVMALVTNRVDRGLAFMPMHFAGVMQGEDRRHKGASKNDVVGVKLDVSRGLPDRGQA